MAIFNSYVCLPEGIYIYISYHYCKDYDWVVSPKRAGLDLTWMVAFLKLAFRQLRHSHCFRMLFQKGTWDFPCCVTRNPILWFDCNLQLFATPKLKRANFRWFLVCRPIVPKIIPPFSRLPQLNHSRRPNPSSDMRCRYHMIPRPTKM